MEAETKKELKTGTTTIGILCKDGIILAADKRVTSGNQIANKRFEKVIPISDNTAITTAGLVSDAQLLTKLIKAEIKLKQVKVGRKLIVKEIVNMLAGLSYANIRQFSSVPGIVGFLVGGFDDTGAHLYEIGIDGSVTESHDFVSDGSGSYYALGCLESGYSKDITVEQAVKLSVKAVNTALQRDTASGDGIDVFSITKSGVKKIMTQEISY